MATFGSCICAGIAALCFISLYRAVIGPHSEDRVTAVSVITTKTILTMIVWASVTESYEFIDVALVCVLVGFAATIAVLKGLYRGHLG